MAYNVFFQVVQLIFHEHVDVLKFFSSYLNELQIGCGKIRKGHFRVVDQNEFFHVGCELMVH